MVTECLLCIRPKEYNCSYCGDPLCSIHVVFDGSERNPFCNFSCFKSWRIKKGIKI